MILESVITCPHCATAKLETMPTNACRFWNVYVKVGRRVWKPHPSIWTFCAISSASTPTFARCLIRSSMQPVKCR